MLFKAIASAVALYCCVVVAVEGRCDDYNKSNHRASLCVYVHTQDYSVPGSGMTCSYTKYVTSIQVIADNDRPYNHCVSGDQMDSPDKSVKACPQELCVNVMIDGQNGKRCLSDYDVDAITVTVGDTNGRVKVYTCLG